MGFAEGSWKDVQASVSTWAQSVAVNPIISSRWDGIRSQKKKKSDFISYLLCKLMIENRITLYVMSTFQGAEPIIL